MRIERTVLSNSSKVFFHADKDNKRNTYDVEYISILPEELQHSIEIYEQQDIDNEEYQIWEYPSGNIYLVVDDTAIDDTKILTEGAYWGLKLAGSDKAKIDTVYDDIYNQPEKKSIWSRLFKNT